MKKYIIAVLLLLKFQAAKSQEIIVTQRINSPLTADADVTIHAPAIISKSNINVYRHTITIAAGAPSAISNSTIHCEQLSVNTATLALANNTKIYCTTLQLTGAFATLSISGAVEIHCTRLIYTGSTDLNIVKTGAANASLLIRHAPGGLNLNGKKISTGNTSQFAVDIAPEQ